MLQLKVLVEGSKVRPKGAVTVPLLYVMISLPTQLLGLSVNTGTV